MRANAVSEREPEKQMAVEGHLEESCSPKEHLFPRTVLTNHFLKDTVSEAFSVSVNFEVGRG